MWAINLAATLGAFALGLGVASGYCLYGATEFVYYAIYPPVRSLFTVSDPRNPTL